MLEKLRAEEFAKAIGKPQATVEDDAAVAVAERIAHLVWAR